MGSGFDSLVRTQRVIHLSSKEGTVTTAEQEMRSLDHKGTSTLWPTIRYLRAFGTEAAGTEALVIVSDTFFGCFLLQFLLQFLTFPCPQPCCNFFQPNTFASISTLGRLSLLFLRYTLFKESSKVPCSQYGFYGFDCIFKA